LAAAKHVGDLDKIQIIAKVGLVRKMKIKKCPPISIENNTVKQHAKYWQRERQKRPVWSLAQMM
jgi:hypothetical protein